MSKKLFAVLLTLVMLIGVLPMSAMATGLTDICEGGCEWVRDESLDQAATCDYVGCDGYRCIKGNHTQCIPGTSFDMENHDPYTCHCDLHTCDVTGEPMTYLWPDCANEGEAYATCSVCGTPNFEEIITLQKDPTKHNPEKCECDLPCEHEYTEKFIQVYPDCAYEGVQYPQCAKCGDVDYTAEKEILEKDMTTHNPVACKCDLPCEHEYTEKFIQVYPDCAYEGVQYPQCAKCGDVDYTAEKEILEKDMTTHNPVACQCEKECEHDEYEAARVEPNCKYEGNIVWKCKDCGAERTEILAKTEDHDEYEAARVEPNCKYEGNIVWKCKDCGAERTEILAKTEDHDEYEAARVEPNCKYEGNIVWKCKDCGAERTETLAKKFRHNWQKATCENPKTCKDCGKTVGRPLYRHDWAKATCENPKTCKDCGKTVGRPLHHSWKKATCESPKTCRHCGKTVGHALKHDWAEATCKSPKTCKDCGKTVGTAHNAVDHNRNGRCDKCNIRINNFFHKHHYNKHFFNKFWKNHK